MCLGFWKVAVSGGYTSEITVFFLTIIYDLFQFLKTAAASPMRWELHKVFGVILKFCIVLCSISWLPLPTNRKTKIKILLNTICTMLLSQKIGTP